MTTLLLLSVFSPTESAIHATYPRAVMTETVTVDSLALKKKFVIATLATKRPDGQIIYSHVSRSDIGCIKAASNEIEIRRCLINAGVLPGQ